MNSFHHSWIYPEHTLLVWMYDENGLYYIKCSSRFTDNNTIFLSKNQSTLRWINFNYELSLCSQNFAADVNLPFSFKNYFILNKTTHDHFTRCCDNIHIVGCNSVIRSYSIRVYGPKIWNNILLDICSAPSIHIFKKKN